MGTSQVVSRGWLVTLMLCVFTSNILAGHRLIMQGNMKLAIVSADGQIEGEMPWGGIHDIHVLDNGNIMVHQHMTKVVEIDVKTKPVVWQLNRFDLFGNSASNSQLLDVKGPVMR